MLSQRPPRWTPILKPTSIDVDVKISDLHALQPRNFGGKQAQPLGRCPQRLEGLHITSLGFPKPLSYKPNSFCTRKSSLDSLQRGEKTLASASSGDPLLLGGSLDLGEGFPNTGLKLASTENQEEGSFGDFLGLPKESFINLFDPFEDLFRGKYPIHFVHILNRVLDPPFHPVFGTRSVLLHRQELGVKASCRQDLQSASSDLAPWLREVGVAERRPVRTSRDVRSGRSSRPRHRRVLYFPHRRLWIMECSCKAMQTQAHTQAALQAQLEAQERADVWWASLLRTRFEDGTVDVAWDEFVRLFRAKFVPEHIQDRMEQEFLSLA
ncbi:hypothetical protein Taro_032745 [Colocasia esculenta]|uniref:Retrotransposon gag domain-containing protein n=1 Tax=Colocasia esculenta TaxID=4460 RepID=A0A843W704_COLES|nr:hypothetical protein [Colocasia esculenta]